MKLNRKVELTQEATVLYNCEDFNAGMKKFASYCRANNVSRGRTRAALIAAGFSKHVTKGLLWEITTQVLLTKKEATHASKAGFIR